ncbi:fork head domain protein [Trichuris suis]|nr:fork head domain protein [Trichuris suis]
MDEQTEGRLELPTLLDPMSLSSLDDLSCLVTNSSFDVGSNSEDSFGWYRKDDAERFRELTGGEDVFNFSIGDSATGAPASPYFLDGCLNSNQSPRGAELAREWKSSGDGLSQLNRLSSSQVSRRQEPPKIPPTIVPPSSVLKYPKPPYSYSCMIALALKNSTAGCLRVSEIYDFIIENFPFFVTAPSGWKNSVRHNLSLNKSFVKIEVPTTQPRGRKCCLWSLNGKKVSKIELEIQRVREKDSEGIKDSLANPGDLDLIEQGLKGMPKVGKARPAEAFSCMQQTNQPFSPATIPRRESPGAARYIDYVNLITNQRSAKQTDLSLLASQSSAISSISPVRYQLPNAVGEDLVSHQDLFRPCNQVSKQLFSNECDRPHGSVESSFPRYNSAQSLTWQYDHPVENCQPIVDTFSAPPSVYYSPSRQTMSLTSSPTNTFASIPYKGAYISSPSRWTNTCQQGIDTSRSNTVKFPAYQSPP